MVKKITVLLLIALAFSSCVSRKKIVYFQNVSDLSTNNYEPRLQPDDELLIIVNVTSPNEALAAPFNPTTTNLNPGVGSGRAGEGRVYLVDKNGFIQLPLVGLVKVGGLTKADALKAIETGIKKYINEPIITLRTTNFKFTVLGEVKSPGTFNFTSERLTLPEAIGMAGDLTVYGKRKNILVIRDIGGKKTYNYIDITQVDFMQSDFYYIAQNDLIYVEPNRVQVNASAIGRDITIAMSLVSFTLVLITFITR